MVITKKQYAQYLKACRRVDAAYDDHRLDAKKIRFTTKHQYPTVADLKLHKVEEHFEEYFPYLLYYENIYETEKDDFRFARAYIKILMKRHLRFLDDIVEESENWLAKTKMAPEEKELFADAVSATRSLLEDANADRSAVTDAYDALTHATEGAAVS